ncbi:MAG: hypothetical protein O2856_06580 [Planctomycetota bacterium]|nr:hypothetical protein [Planctomycetota bacterium]
MNTRISIVSALCIVVVAPSLVQAIADEVIKAASPRDEVIETERLSKLIEDAVDDYQFYESDTSSTPLIARPVLRWRNAARGQDGEAMMVVWLSNGHPKAMASIYPWDGNLCTESDLLSREIGLVAKQGEAVMWAPLTVGVNFRKVPQTKTPAATPVARLREMKAIAGRFAGTMMGWNQKDSDREMLRLLPRPLYRYELTADPKSASSPAAFDGGLFAFAMGTDPEIVLILEAVGEGDSASWEYACVRATSGALEMRLDDSVIWTGVKFPVQSERGPHFTIQQLLPDSE